MKVDLNRNHHLDEHRRNVRNAMSKPQNPDDLSFWQHLWIRGKTRAFWFEVACILIGGALILYSLVAMGQIGR